MQRILVTAVCIYNLFSCTKRTWVDCYHHFYKLYSFPDNLETIYILLCCTEISSFLQFIKVKIIPEKILVSVLFTLTKHKAKMWAYSPRSIPATKKKNNPTRACWVHTNHKKYIHIYLREKYIKICYIFVLVLSSYVICFRKLKP